MKLLFVIDYLGAGGAQRQMVNLANGLVAKSHKVEFFVYYPDYNHFNFLLKKSDIYIHSYQKKGRLDWRPIHKLRKLLCSQKYNLALAFLRTPAFYLELASIGQKTPIIVSERFMYTSKNLGFLNKFLQKVHHLSDHITVNSYHQYNRMAKMFPWMQAKMSVIYNGIDLEYFQPVRHPLNQISAKNFRFLVLSSIVPKKNSLALILALRKFYDTYPQYHNQLTIQWAGKVSEDILSQDEFKRANTLLHEFGLQKSWKWLGEYTDVPNLLRNVDALIHPSYQEGLPNAICEALASGLPVLASNVGDHSRLIEDGKNGFLFSPREPETIAKAICEFCDMSKEDRVQMSSNARRFAEENLSLERYVLAYESLFERLTVDKERN